MCNEWQPVSKDYVEVYFVEVFSSLLNGFAMSRVSECNKITKNVSKIAGVNERTIVGGGDQMQL